MAILALLWAGPAVWFCGAIGGRQRAIGAHTVHLDRANLVLRDGAGATRRIAGAEIERGSLGAGGALVLELRDARRLTIALGEERALEVLAALGLAPGARRAVFVWHRARAVVAGTLIGLALPLLCLIAFPTKPVAVLTVPLISGLPWLIAAWLGAFASRRTLTVGGDGIELRAMGRRRVYRFADVIDVRSSPERLDVVLSDGSTEGVLSERDAPATRAEIARWIREARQRPRGSEMAVRAIDRAARAGRRGPSGDAQMLDAARGFREATVTAEDVACILHDPIAAPAQRIAAASALAASGDPEHVARVRVAAGAVVSPKLRVALEAAADDALDDEMIAAACEEAANASRAAGQRSSR